MGSSDAVNNLLIGAVSQSLLDALGWEGYFPCIAVAAGLLVVGATAAFPGGGDCRAETAAETAAPGKRGEGALGGDA